MLDFDVGTHQSAVGSSIHINVLRTWFWCVANNNSLDFILNNIQFELIFVIQRIYCLILSVAKFATHNLLRWIYFSVLTSNKNRYLAKKYNTEHDFCISRKKESFLKPIFIYSIFLVDQSFSTKCWKSIESLKEAREIIQSQNEQKIYFVY